MFEKTASILIVDDETSVRSLLLALLGKQYHCVGAGDAKEAIACFNEQSFDLLLTDVAMPGSTGVELAKFVLANHPSTRIILMSGNFNDDAAAEVDAMGLNFIRKPFNVWEIQDLIQQVLGEEK